tara:strand:- start:880 stop:1029 length:150 start_codon:yes stop_codon:yes gene_type:complete
MVYGFIDLRTNVNSAKNKKIDPMPINVFFVLTYAFNTFLFMLPRFVGGA